MYFLVCKFKAHKRCAVRATNNCKWTTLASIGKDIIEDEDGVSPCVKLFSSSSKILKQKDQYGRSDHSQEKISCGNDFLSFNLHAFAL